MEKEFRKSQQLHTASPLKNIQEILFTRNIKARLSTRLRVHSPPPSVPTSGGMPNCLCSIVGEMESFGEELKDRLRKAFGGSSLIWK